MLIETHRSYVLSLCDAYMKVEFWGALILYQINNLPLLLEKIIFGHEVSIHCGEAVRCEVIVFQGPGECLI